LTTRLTLGPDGGFQPVPQFSDLRNRALCDVFFGISAMERAGTGLTDAYELAAELGGAATFAYSHGPASFRARTTPDECEGSHPCFDSLPQPRGPWSSGGASPQVQLFPTQQSRAIICRRE